MSTNHRYIRKKKNRKKTKPLQTSNDNTESVNNNHSSTLEGDAPYQT